MANEKVASVKLQLNNSSYILSIKDVGKANEEAAQKSENAWKKSGVAGLKAFKSAAEETATSIKNTIKFAASLGGAFSFGAAVKGAVDAQSEFRNLSFAIKAGTGQLLDWQALQKDAQETGLAWGQSSRDLGKVMSTVFKDVGDANFAKAAMKEVAKDSRATGENLGTLGAIAGSLNEKFEVTAEQLPEAMAAAISLGNQGGLTLETMAAKLDMFGAAAKAVGLKGMAGFQQIAGMANLADNALGGMRKSVPAVTKLLEDMATPEASKKIYDAFGVSTKDALGNARNFTKVMGEVFKLTGGKREKLALAFTGEQLNLVVEIAKTYTETFNKTTGTVKQKTDAALAAYQEAIRKAGESQLKAADVQAEATRRMDDPQARLAASLEKLQQAFTKPQMLDAIDKLSERLPELAEKMAKLIGFVLENPGTSLAIAAGLKLGAPALQAALSAAAPSVGKAIMGALGQGGGAFSSGGAPGALAKGAGVVGGAAAVAAAGVAGYAIADQYANQVIDPARAKSAAIAGGLKGATLATEINTSGRIDPEAAKASLETLRQRIDEARKDKQFSASDVYTLGLRRLGTSSDDDINKAQAAYDQGIAALEQKMAPAANKTADTLEDLHEAARGAAEVLRSFAPPTAGGGAPSRGPIRPAPPAPGYLPR